MTVHAVSTVAPSPRERLFSAAAWLYLVLLPCPIPLAGPLFVHDLLAPIFAFAVVLRGDWRRWLRAPDLWLAGFGLWCVLVTVTRRLGSADLYELAIVAYMGLLYAFFSRTRMASRGLGLYAVLVVISLWVVGAVQAVNGLVRPHSAYVGTTLDFLATRYGYTFANPNLLGSFAVLPLACAMLAWHPPRGQGAGSARRRWLLRLTIFGAAFAIPLLLSASRHLLLSFALVLGALSAAVLPRHRPVARAAAWAALLSVFALFYLTIVIPFFPLQTAPPFVNCRTPGMYMIHQAAYLDLVLTDAGTLLRGVGRTAVRSRYAEVVDRDLAQAVLAQYHMQELLSSFMVYMDAHNDYLNLASAFGLPAVLAAYGFLVALAWQRRPGDTLTGGLLLFFVAALCLAALWDDLLSKRWIWVTLGLLAAAASGSAEQAPRAAADTLADPGRSTAS